MGSLSTFTEAVIVGILLGLSVKIGFNFNANDILINATSNVFQLVNIPETISFWHTISFVIGGLGTIGLVLEIISVISEGVTGIIMTVFGTVGPFLFIGYNQPLGIALIVFGAAIAVIGPQPKKS